MLCCQDNYEAVVRRRHASVSPYWPDGEGYQDMAVLCLFRPRAACPSAILTCNAFRPRSSRLANISGAEALLLVTRLPANPTPGTCTWCSSFQRSRLGIRRLTGGRRAGSVPMDRVMSSVHARNV